MSAGLTVTVEGEPPKLPPGVDLAAFRILQEAPTNVVRHSGSRHARVRIEQDAGLLRLRIDDGPATGADAGGSGNGLAGMRERAAAPDGTIEAGPRPGGGLRVLAVLPLDVKRTGVRVLLADDQSLVRAGLRALLDAQRDIEVAGEAAGGVEAVRLIRELRPDVVLMDIRMPALDGLAATRRVTGDTDLKDVKVVMLTTFELAEYLFEVIRSGASGFLVKDTEPEELLRAVRAVVAGDVLLSPGVTRRLIAEFAARSKESAAVGSLAELTEREVMALVGIGLSNEEIARRLVVSSLTTKTHVSRTMVELVPATGRNWSSWPMSRAWYGRAGRVEQPPGTAAAH